MLSAFIHHTATVGHVSHPYSKGRYFTQFHKNMTWGEARNFCEYVGGHLAVLNTKNVDEFVVKKFPNERLWITLMHFQCK